MRAVGSSRAGTRLRRRLAAVAVAAVAATLVVTPSSLGIVSIEDLEGQTEAKAFDVRTAAVAPSAEQIAAVERLGADVRWNEFATPQSLVKHGGYLATGVEADTAVAAARSWLDANKGLFRLTSLEGLELVDDAELVDSDGHAVAFRQTFGRLAASPDGVVVVGLVETSRGGWNVAYVSSRVTGDTDVVGSADLSAVEAWVESARRAGEDVSTADVRVVGRENGWILLEVAGLDEVQSVRPAAFPTPRRGTLRAYETTVVSGPDEGYWQIVDAERGGLLFRESVVDHAAENPTWSTFPAYPQMTQINRFPWNYPSADTRDVWCWFPAPGCKLVLANPASPFEWDREGTNAVSFTTAGNNARSQENWLHPFLPGGSTQPPPTSPTRDYTFPWANVWFEDLCNPDNLVPGGNDIDAATVALFAGHNRMHDWSYHLGFFQERWNAQDNNFGRPTLGNDRILGNVQAGALSTGRDNANMFTRPDGTNSWSNMYLWQPLAGAFYAPCVDGDFDMAVIGHEYSHMIENRMIGKGNRRQGFHAGAMGESFSDFDAMEYLNEYGFVPVSGEDPWAVGAYVTGDGDQAIRNYNMSWPGAGHFPQPGLDPFVNPLNFGDVGYDLTGPQVHADGEIWSATNFDLRELLLDRYPQKGLNHQRECADGERPVAECPGNRRWIQLYYDAMLLMPVAPTFLDARDAILAADVMRFGGANQDLLWLGFARRGFGHNAATTGTQDSEPIPDFESPLHDEATVIFNAVSQETGAPVPADIFVGHYEARVTPIADTDPATGGPNRDNVAGFVPDDPKPARSAQRAYDFVANAEGYGHVRFRLAELKPGETREVTIHFPTNVASTHQGAVAAGDGANHDDLIDDTEGTDWDSAGAPVQGRQVLVDLAGGARTFQLVKVSAHLLGSNRFTALREFEVYACQAGGRVNPDCDPATQSGWKRILKSQKDAFPSVNPRPRAPELILRAWQVPTTTATHVLFRVLENQCTGQSSYQGEQDNDPGNFTDCRTGGPSSVGVVLPPRNAEVHAAELQVLTGRPVVEGAQAAE